MKMNNFKFPRPEDAPVTTETTPSGGAAWDKDIPADVRGDLELRGLAGKPPTEVVANLHKAWKSAEAFRGIPTEQLLRLPKDDAPTEEREAFYNRLGKPKEAKDYGLDAIELGGTKIGADEAAALAAAAHKSNLPAASALEYTKGIMEFVNQRLVSQAAERTAAVTKEKEGLAQDWGPRMDANKFIANQAAEKLGVSKETIAAMESQIGYKGMMEMFLKIGTQMGEDKFVVGGGTNNQAMTATQAQAQLNDLKKDKDWIAKWNRGDMEARKQFNALTTLIAGGDDTQTSRKW